MSRLTESVRSAYQAFAENSGSVWDLIDENVVFHVSGGHPLSGDYVGVREVRRYLTSLKEATGGRGGFSVTSAFADDTGDEILVEGTAFHGEGPYVRTIVHRLRVAGGKVVEFRDHPFDQQAEDRFWSARVPAQRDGRGADAGIAPLVPAQPAAPAGA